MSQFLASFFLIRINKKTSVFLHNAPKILREGKILAYLLVSFERERERENRSKFLSTFLLFRALKLRTMILDECLEEERRAWKRLMPIRRQFRVLNPRFRV